MSMIIMFTAKLVVTGLVAGAGSVIQVQPSSDFDQNYQTTPILFITLAIFVNSSSILSFHSVLVDTVMFCISEGGEQRQSLWSKEFNKIFRFRDQEKGIDNLIYLETM